VGAKKSGLPLVEVGGREKGEQKGKDGGEGKKRGRELEEI